MFNFLKLFFFFLFHQKSFIIGSQERFEKRACFFLLKMIKKSVYKGIPYQIEISNTQNRLLTQNPPSKVDYRPKISGLRTKIKIARAVELRSSKFWKIWKAESTLLNLGTTFMGRNPLCPAEARASKKNKEKLHRWHGRLGSGPQLQLRRHMYFRM